MQSGPGRLECFLSCSSLGSTDVPKRETLSPFAVVYVERRPGAGFAEVSRTETCPANTSPAWSTSVEVEHDEGADAATVRVDVYNRLHEGAESLQDNELFGRTVFSTRDLTEAPGMHFLSPISHRAKERERVGILQVVSEPRSLSPSSGELIEIDVMCSVLRKRDWGAARIPQFFEIFRTHAHDDAAGGTVWLPVYRSNRLVKQEKANGYLEFSRVTVTNGHLCNGDEERRIRFVLHAGERRPGKSTEVGFVDVTLRDLCEVDPTEEVFEIETDGAGADGEAGSMVLLKAEPTDVGSYFSVQVNHASCGKYVSSASADHGKRSRISAGGAFGKHAGTKSRRGMGRRKSKTIGGAKGERREQGDGEDASPSYANANLPVSKDSYPLQDLGPASSACNSLSAMSLFSADAPSRQFSQGDIMPGAPELQQRPAPSSEHLPDRKLTRHGHDDSRPFPDGPHGGRRPARSASDPSSA
jgi:hypothetical protein